MKQSLRDVGAAMAEKVNEAKQKINEIQQLPPEIPESWDEQIDEHGEPYYVDTESGEWYRVVGDAAKGHKRIDTNEKLSIITAESKKEFDDQKEKMDEDEEESVDLETDDEDESHDPTKTPIHDDILKSTQQTATASNGHSKPKSKKKSNHSKRSSTSVSKGWQCEKCTLENKGHDLKCNACLAPRPYRSEDDDDEEEDDTMGPILEAEEKQETMDNDLLSVDHGNKSSAHRQMNTMEAIAQALDASLEELGGDEVKNLDTKQKEALMTFMDVIEDAEVSPSIKYLRNAQWDMAAAVESYFEDHPNKPKSRNASLILGDTELDAIMNEPINFNDDIALPPDLEKKHRGTVGDRHRGSQELDEVPNGVRSSDDEEEEEQPANNQSEPEPQGQANMIPNNNILNGNQVDGDSEDSEEEPISYDPEMNTGNRTEYPIYNEADRYDAVAPSHNRLDTEQQIMVAEQLSLQQSKIDEQFDDYRKEIAELKQQLEAEQKENERLREENEQIKKEKDRYADQAREIQSDWDRMSGYMTEILSEVQHIEEARKQGQDITTPTPKLNAIFEQIQTAVSRSGDSDHENHKLNNIQIKVENGKKSGQQMDNMYANVAELFADKAPDMNVNGMQRLEMNGGSEHNGDDTNKRSRKLSFGAVNELFGNTAPADLLKNRNPSGVDASSSSSPSLPSQFLNVTQSADNEHEKRLSYGGVGLLFDVGSQSQSQSHDHEHSDEINENEETVDDYNAAGNPLAVSFKPSYQGIAALFDENQDILGSKMSNKHSLKSPSFGGDIVELFTDPNNEFVRQFHSAQKGDVAEVQEEEEEEEQPIQQQAPQEYEDDDDVDSMDEQHFYNDDDDDDEEDEEEEEEDGDEEEEEQNNQRKQPRASDKQRVSTHQRFESYNSNLSDPTPMSRRGSQRKHSRGPSFAFRDLFRGDDDESDSEHAPSVQSAPEEQDYYAITAYYGIEDDEAGGWDSRRSSLFGDYGRVHSRRQSKRVQETSAQVKQMFEVDVGSRLHTHLVANPDQKGRSSTKKPEPDNVADLFSEDTKPSKRFNNTTSTIAEAPDEEEEQDVLAITHGANVVADLFDDDDTKRRESEKPSGFTTAKRETYTGVKALFGSDNIDEEDENSADDEDEEEDDELSSRDVENMRVSGGVKGKNVPRPSTNVALGSTFDSIAMIKDRVSTKPKKSEIVNNNLMVTETAATATAAVNEQRDREQQRQREEQKREQRQMEEEELQKELEQRIDAVREEEASKFSELKQKLQEEFDSRLESVRREIESETDERLRKELAEQLRPQIEDECRGAMREEMERQLEERLHSAMDDKMSARMKELQNTFDAQMEQLRREMNERETSHQREVQSMQQSKLQLIQHTAKEIDTLRQMIKQYNPVGQYLEHQQQQSGHNNNNNGAIGTMLAGWLK